MRGGKRLNAGRKLSEQKKVGTKIYLTPEVINAVENFSIGKSFSEKCSHIIEEYIKEERKEKSKTIRFVDLFAGMGGIRLGFTQAIKRLGYNPKCVFSSELKKYAIQVYKNYYDNEQVYGDITKIEASFIPEFDFLLAGFPCQPFSFAGKGLGFDDTRGTLFFDIERILREKKPYGFLLENVEGLVKHDKGKTLSIIISHLENLGYTVSWKLLDSQFFGLAQSRKRVYIVGTKDGKAVSLENFIQSNSKLGDVLERGLPTVDSRFTKCLFKHYNVDEIVGKSIKDKRGGKDNIHSWDIGLKGNTTDLEKELLNRLLTERRKKHWAKEIGIKWMDGMPLTQRQIATFFENEELEAILHSLVAKGYLKIEHPKDLVNGIRIADTTKEPGYNIVAGKLSFEFSQILDPNRLAPTLVAMDVSKLGVIDNAGIRRLTVREGCRLCGYPEDYDMSMINEKEAFDLLGNTVCVPVISAVAERLLRCYLRLE